ncbi:DUF4123 domain-containing protein [Vibrio sp. TRT 21S02]|uniref:DUF4123 domain-containing protein n=1 Tax=unclassified Vibrio TaxID=2614977 RepID=UPI003CF44EED
MLKAWFSARQQNNFWLVDKKGYQTVIQANHGKAIDDAMPLFQGEQFSEVLDLSPWLLPISSELLSLADDVFTFGIGLSTSVEQITLIQHLRSLLVAAYEGEEMMFRFYDTNVLSPMFETMDAGERSAFLGCVSELAICHDGELAQYDSDMTEHWAHQDAIWWKILPKHLAPLYKVTTHAKALERRFWQKLPDSMAQLDDPYQTLLTAMESAQQRNLSAQDIEFVAIKTLMSATNTHLSVITQAFHLSQDEQSQLMNTQEKIG